MEFINSKIQRIFPDLYGEENVLMHDPLHIEMVSLEMMGDFPDGSVWCSAIALLEYVFQA